MAPTDLQGCTTASPASAPCPRLGESISTWGGSPLSITPISAQNMNGRHNPLLRPTFENSAKSISVPVLTAQH